jgi:hypothetical protein
MDLICRRAGFDCMEAVLTLPPRFAHAFGREWKPMASASYLRYTTWLERLFLLIPPSRVRRQITRLARVVLFSPAILMRAYKK